MESVVSCCHDLDLQKLFISVTGTRTRTTEVTTTDLRTWCSKFSSLECQLKTNPPNFYKGYSQMLVLFSFASPSCFTGIKTNGSVSGTKTGVPREKHPAHPQAKLGLSTLPESALHPQDDMVE